MNVAELLPRASAVLSEWGQEVKPSDPNRLDFTVSADRLVKATEALATARWGYLSAITGLDLGPAAKEMEVLYSFCEGPAVVTLRVRISRDEPRVPTLRTIIPHVVLFERELAEMFGVEIVGENAPQHVYLSEDWPAGSYPQRKDWKPAQEVSAADAEKSA